MSKLVQDAAKALGYIGQTVLVELRWEDDNEMLWRCYHIVGAVLPVPGVFDAGYFLTAPFSGNFDFPDEIYFDSIRTIQPMRQRDRNGSGRVLGHIALPEPVAPWSDLAVRQATMMEGERRHA